MEQIQQTEFLQFQIDEFIFNKFSIEGNLSIKKKQFCSSLLFIRIIIDMQRNYDYILKIVFVGPSGVGKTALLRRYADDYFEENLLPTIGVDFKFKSFNIEGDFVKLQLWDTAGQQRFRSVVESYYKDADAIILVSDISNSLSFQQIDQYWLYEVRRHMKKESQIFLFVNKADDPRLDLRREERDWCERERLPYFMVSAKTGREVQDAISIVTRRVKQVKPKEQNTKIIMGLSEFTPELKKKKCC